jgi:uncharacterized membrane protein (Fun14 family)
MRAIIVPLVYQLDIGTVDINGVVSINYDALSNFVESWLGTAGQAGS